MVLLTLLALEFSWTANANKTLDNSMKEGDLTTAILLNSYKGLSYLEALHLWLLNACDNREIATLCFSHIPILYLFTQK